MSGVAAEEPQGSRGLALLLAALGIAAGVLGWHGLVPLIRPDPAWTSMAARLGSACLALVPAAAVLWLMLVVQMAARLGRAAFEPARRADTGFLATNQRAISNTLEQMAVFCPALMALAAGAPAGAMGRIVALALVFAVARLVFWLGYLFRPMLRAPGMSASFVSSSAALFGSIYVWFF